MPEDCSALSASSCLRSAWFSPSFGEARRPASAKATAGHPNAAAALGTPAVRRSFSEGGSASGAKAAAVKRRTHSCRRADMDHDVARGAPTMVASSVDMAVLEMAHRWQETLVAGTSARERLAAVEVPSMPRPTLASRVDRLGRRVESLEALPERMDRLESQFLQ